MLNHGHISFITVYLLIVLNANIQKLNVHNTKLVNFMKQKWKQWVFKLIWVLV